MVGALDFARFALLGALQSVSHSCEVVAPRMLPRASLTTGHFPCYLSVTFHAESAGDSKWWAPSLSGCLGGNAIDLFVNQHDSEMLGTSAGRGVAHVPLVRGRNTFTQLDRRVPAEGVDPRGVEQLARHAIGLGGVPFDLTLEPDHRRHRLGEFLDRQVIAPAHIDRFGGVVVVDEHQAGIGQVVHVQELPAW